MRATEATIPVGAIPPLSRTTTARATRLQIPEVKSIWPWPRRMVPKWLTRVESYHLIRMVPGMLAEALSVQHSAGMDVKQPF